jgi:hypothetical protein
MIKANKRMSIKLQDILLSEGCNPKHFKYIKANASDIVFKHIKSGKEVYFRY